MVQSSLSLARSRVGIVGGGQLGLYLCHAAKALNLSTVVLAPTADCPASAAADELLVGGMDDLASALRLAAACDVLTFELEAVAPGVLEGLESYAAGSALRIAPSPRVMLLLQNKIRQRRWLAEAGFPGPDFTVVESVEDAAAAGEAAARLGLPLVLKSPFGGYDGRGVCIVRSRQALRDLLTAPALVEAFVPHSLELTVVVARGWDGCLSSYVPVATAFHATGHVLETAVAPAPVPDQIAEQAMKLAGDVVTRLDGVGVFAVEMFLTPDQRVLVNEISPRVHNSGHLTLEACATSQFSQHVRAVAGLPLGPVSQHRAAVMKNVLYGPELAGLCATYDKPFVSGGGDTFVHWYGKKEGRPLRKMGHVTGLGADPASAERHADRGLRALLDMASTPCAHEERVE